MGRILGIDYGLKRIGLAVTDPLQIIVTGLDTIDTPQIHQYLEKYFKNEEIDKIVIGYPFFDHVFNVDFKNRLDAFIKKIKKVYQPIPVDLQDESFTSVESKRVIFASGTKKSKRREKKRVDKVSAVLILQEYLGHI